MARTRWVYQRPTASVCRERAANNAPEVEEPHGQVQLLQPADEVPVPVKEVPIQQEESFPGGPEDLSVLRSFREHVAIRLWSGEEHGVLKVINNGRKASKIIIESDYIKNLVENSGLASLQDYSYATVDRGTLSAFTERWQRETCSFHMPFGEMTITLDDVSSILHLPITGIFPSLPIMSDEIAKDLLVELLGVTETEANREMQSTRGRHIRFLWL